MGKGDQTITLKQIIGQHWLYNGAVRGLPYRNTMVFVLARAYVHMHCIHGVMSGSLCASGDWLDVYKDRQRESGGQTEDSWWLLRSFTGIYKVMWGCFELKV